MGKYYIKRPDEEIHLQLDQASKGVNEGTLYPGMSYEEGIICFWEWLIGEIEEKPFE